MTTTQEGQGFCAWQAFLAGFALGGTAAILLAPYNGREFRDRLVTQAKAGSDAVVDAVGKASDALGKAMDSAQSFATDVPNMVERGKERVRAEGARIASAVDAARTTYSERASS